ncbi:MAG: NAD(P)/FAD-dependent oxidoreductase [Candidatus Omnitrophica bacterium]|nr:NAD(P)/FAD-dependent oxidoreductase [Candidatus Omnitrophota bacterium]
MSILNLKTDVIIIGAGAAGLMCAIEAGKRGRQVIVLERNDRIGKKIRISGGGRCNFTNIFVRPETYLSENPHFAKSALARYTAEHFCELVKRHRISFHEKKLGQLFCDDSAQDVIDLLTKECEQNGVKILTSTTVNQIQKDDQFCVSTASRLYESKSLVIATGGLSIPTLGATDLGYKIARQFGLHIITPRPGLVPLVWGKEEQNIFQELSGVSINTVVYFQDQTFRENILFTHRGLSGPAILQISSYWENGQPIAIDLLPEVNILEIFKAHASSKMEMKNLLIQYLPRRFVDVFCSHYIHNKPLNQYSPHEFDRAAQIIHHWEIVPAGTEGYSKAEVTVGGVDTNELSSKTMESNKIAGLYFIGEVVDVTGHLGGYNFQWAWASGYVAGQYV